MNKEAAEKLIEAYRNAVEINSKPTMRGISYVEYYQNAANEDTARVNLLSALIGEAPKGEPSEAMRVLLNVFLCQHCHDHFTPVGQDAVECSGCRQLWPLSILPLQAALFCDECGGSGEVTEEDVVRCPKCDGSRVRIQSETPKASEADLALMDRMIPPLKYEPWGELNAAWSRLRAALVGRVEGEAGA